MYSGPDIERGGLVFGYDTGQFASTNPNFEKFKPGGVKSKRFFKGKPSINYAAHRNAVPQSSYTSYTATTSGTWVEKHPGSIRAYNGQGTDISYSSNSGVGDWTNTYHAYWTYDKQLKKPVIQMNAFDSNWKAKSFGVGMGAWSSLGVSAGDKYVISWLQWTTNTNLRADAGFYSKNTSNSRGFHDGRQTPGNTKTHKWERVHAVYTVSSNRNLNDSLGSIYMYGHTTSNGAGKILKIADVQLEILTDHPSDYLDSKSTGTTTSRSSTESLIDLTKTTNIDVSNVSFDSDGLPTFDGTDDRINGTWPSSFNINDNTTPRTWEAVFNSSNTGGRRGIFGHKNSSGCSYHCNGGIFIYDGIISFNWYDNAAYRFLGSQTVSSNTYYHVVATFDTDRKPRIYVNGILNSTYSSATNLDYSSGMGTYDIGWNSKSGGQHYFTGTIPVVKFYKNKALTADEVQQNFKAYKNRFDI